MIVCLNNNTLQKHWCMFCFKKINTTTTQDTLLLLHIPSNQGHWTIWYSSSSIRFCISHCEWRYFIPSKNQRLLPFSALFTDLSCICDFMPVYSLGKGLGLGTTGPSVLPAAISTERSKISNQFMQNKYQSWLSSWSVDTTMVSQECHTLQNVWEGMILSDTNSNTDTQSLFAVCHLKLQSNKAGKWNYELPWAGKDGQ